MAEFKYGRVPLIQHPRCQRGDMLSNILDYLMVYCPRFLQIIFVTALGENALVSYSYFIINRLGYFNYHRPCHRFSFRTLCCQPLIHPCLPAKYQDFQCTGIKIIGNSTVLSNTLCYTSKPFNSTPQYQPLAYFNAQQPVQLMALLSSLQSVASF